MDQIIRGKEKVSKMPQYFVNLNNPKEGNIVNLKNLELHVPEGFQKHLSREEKHKLLNEQLAEYGLRLGDLYRNQLERMKKKPEPLRTSASTPKRLKEYLILFEAEQTKNKYKNSKQPEINEQIDEVINYICKTVKNAYVPTDLLARMAQGLAELVKARDTIKTAPYTANEQIDHETITQLCRPALNYIRENFDPYVTIHINSDGIEVTRSICGIPEIVVNKKRL